MDAARPSQRLRTAPPAAPPPRLRLEPEAERRLESRALLALRRARAAGTATLASLTTALPNALDPTGAAVAARRPGEDWFCLEQPDRQGWALAALGSLRRLEARGPERFA